MAASELNPQRWRGRSPLFSESQERSLERLEQDVNRLFEDFKRSLGHLPFAPESWGRGEYSPRFDETEDDKAIHVTAEIPGVEEKDFDITLSDNVLTLRGERKEEAEKKGKRFHRRECVYGTFLRSITLPAEVDESKIRASFRNGILTIDLPKTKKRQKKARRITVRAA